MARVFAGDVLFNSGAAPRRSRGMCRVLPADRCATLQPKAFDDPGEIVGLTQLMSSLPFGVSAVDALTFMTVTGALVIVALAACFVPARRPSAFNRQPFCE